MSRQLLAAFHALLDDVCITWADAGENVGARGEDQARFDREAQRARRKLDKAMQSILLPACYLARPRGGHPSDREWLKRSVAALESEAPKGRPRTAHGYVTRRKA